MKGNSVGFVVMFAVGLVALAGCRGGDDDSRAIEIVIPTEIATLDPRFSTRGLDIKTTRLVHAGLVGLHPSTLEPVPLVAASWVFLDHRSLELTLAPNVVFHSGEPLEVADVCATIGALKDPALASPHRAVVQAIGSCEERGARKVLITLSEPRATLLTDLEVPILRAEQASLPPRPDGELDGLGPFRVDQAKPTEVVLAPAATGVLPEPRHPVVVRTVRDENARAQRLLAGRSDIAPNAISPALLPALEGREGLDVVSRLGANVTYLLLHNERSPFDRVEIRRGLARAIDRELIVQTLLAGRGNVARWLFPPGHWASTGDVSVPSYDPSAARAALGGQAREVSLLSSTDRARLVIARAIAQMLEDAGLDVRVIPLDLGVMLERLDSGDYDMAILQMPELTEPNILKWFFHPAAVPGEGGVGRNRARYRDVRVGRALDAASAIADRRERTLLYRFIARRMTNDLPVIPLWHEDQVAVVSQRASGFEPSAEGRWLDVASLE